MTRLTVLVNIVPLPAYRANIPGHFPYFSVDGGFLKGDRLRREQGSQTNQYSQDQGIFHSIKKISSICIPIVGERCKVSVFLVGIVFRIW